jgi:hypothetical protein
LKKIYNITGREIALFANNEFVNAGTNGVWFNTSYSPNEVYIYSIKAGEFIETKKMIFKI